MTSRRQYQSCDYCRRRRRKCDAATLGINQHTVRAPDCNNNACHNCAKAGRVCSFTWLVGQGPSRPRPSGTIQEGGRRSHSWSQRAHGADNMNTSTACFSFPDPLQFDESNEVDMQILLQDLVGANVIAPPFSSSAPSSAASGPLLAIDSITPFENVTYDDPVPTSLELPDAESVQHLWEIPMQSQSATESSWPDAPQSSTAAKTMSSPNTLSSYVPTFNAANGRLASHATRYSVTDLLIQVYHTNLEGILSSWSTAVTCPYVPRHSDRSNSQAHVSSSFYDRVRRMDAVLPQSGFAGVAESAPVRGRQESDVLNKVVLAFASQWGSPSALPPGSPQEHLAESLQEVLHRTLWFDAQRALQSASELGYSFRIIFARLLFSFVHSPISSIETASSEGEYVLSNLASVPPSSHTSPCRPEMAIMTSPSCVVQLEMALRDLLTWRRRMYGSKCNLVDADHPFFVEQQSFLTEFNTLFWLAVMCDTTASVIGGRPLVIADDDCTIQISEPRSPAPHMTVALDHISTRGLDPAIRARGRSVSVWKAILGNDFIETTTPSPLFASDTIEATIKAAIPLKVLLFRRIGILQTLIDRQSVSSDVESAMQDVLLVFSQWEAKYGRFMDKCVDHYGTMSHRVRSWHTILMSHWHYGIMLFASKAETQNNMHLAQDCRPVSAWNPGTLARSSAVQVARLAQSCLEISRMPSTHMLESDNQLTILSEPWCEIMVRSLTMTIQVLLKPNNIDISSARSGGVQACIEALEELGKYRYKTARDIAQSLRLERDGMIAQAV